MLKIIFEVVYVFILGTCIGSFANVVIYRVPRGLNFAMGRSYCPCCRKILKFYDMIPIISWILLKGKCRFCHYRISWRYPCIELIGGIFAIICFYKYGISIMMIISFVFAMILLCVAVIDLDTMIIPNGFIFCIVFLAFISLFFINMPMMERILGVFIWSFPMYCLNIFVSNCFGGGDIKLISACGFLLGWKLLCVGMFIAIILGGSYASYLLLCKKVDKGEHIAFGPYISIGMFVSLLYGYDLLYWYFSL